MSTSLWGRLRQSRTRWPIRLALLLVLGLAGFLWVNRQRSEDWLTVENQSGQPIAQLRLSAGGEGSSYKDVAPGAQVAAPFAVRSGEVFTVEGQLADGTRLRASGRVGERLRFVVL